MNADINISELLNMKHYRMEKLQNKEKSRIEKIIAAGGFVTVREQILLLLLL